MPITDADPQEESNPSFLSDRLLVEIFEDRMEISNPGIPLVDVQRFLDLPPRSHNETLASFMRRIGVCEERGSGVDKVVFQTEFYQLPAPAFEVAGDNTRAVLFAHRFLSKMDKADRIRSCYLHACLRYVNRDFMTNTSLRNRFGIDPKNSAVASRLIKEAMDTGVIRPFDETSSKKLMMACISYGKGELEDIPNRTSRVFENPLDFVI